MERTPFEDSGAEEEPAPPTEAKGELVPPPRKPPTAVGVAGQPPKPPRPPDPLDLPEVRWARLRELMDRAFDVLDAAGDAIAARLGLRGRDHPDA
jgi:hypothetical protein